METPLIIASVVLLTLAGVWLLVKAIIWYDRWLVQPERWRDLRVSPSTNDASDDASDEPSLVESSEIAPQFRSEKTRGHRSSAKPSGQRDGPASNRAMSHLSFSPATIAIILITMLAGFAATALAVKFWSQDRDNIELLEMGKATDTAEVANQEDQRPAPSPPPKFTFAGLQVGTQLIYEYDRVGHATKSTSAVWVRRHHTESRIVQGISHSNDGQSELICVTLLQTGGPDPRRDATIQECHRIVEGKPYPLIPKVKRVLRHHTALKHRSPSLCTLDGCTAGRVAREIVHSFQFSEEANSDKTTLTRRVSKEYGNIFERDVRRRSTVTYRLVEVRTPEATRRKLLQCRWTKRQVFPQDEGGAVPPLKSGVGESPTWRWTAPHRVVADGRRLAVAGARAIDMKASQQADHTSLMLIGWRGPTKCCVDVWTTAPPGSDAPRPNRRQRHCWAVAGDKEEIACDRWIMQRRTSSGDRCTLTLSKRRQKGAGTRDRSAAVFAIEPNGLIRLPSLEGDHHLQLESQVF